MPTPYRFDRLGFRVPMFDLFDFARSDDAIPALPKAIVDPDKLEICKQRFPN
jgi:hypothetical protein